MQSRLEFMKATEGRTEMSLQQFIRITRCQSRFYAVSAFDAVDRAKTGRIRFGNYIQFKRLLTFGTVEEKSAFMFSLLDKDGDGWLTKDDVEAGLKASSDENEKPLKKEELSNLLNVLMNLFCGCAEGKINEEQFKVVLASYPDLLGSFQLGELIISSFDHITASTKNIVKATIKYLRRWVFNHPVRFITYIFTVLLISVAFFWQFWRFSGDCSDADLDYLDPITGVTRREIQIVAEKIYGIRISDHDAQYITFSLQMSEQDSVRCQDARLRLLMSWTLPLAKGCGRAMKVVFTLILFPVSRSLMTTLRDTFLRYIFDFDGAISYHKVLGTVGFLLAWVHSIAHFVHVYRQNDSSFAKEWCLAFPSDSGNRLVSLHNVTKDTPHIDGIPMMMMEAAEPQPDVYKIIISPIYLTGFLLLFFYTFAGLFAFDCIKSLKAFKPGQHENKTPKSLLRRVILKIGRILNNFNNFWYTHHLFALFYVVLVFHPMPQNLEGNIGALTDAWVWILVPVLIYFADRVYRGLQKDDCTPLIGVTTLPGRVLVLKTAKPKRLQYKPGQYVMIKCNQVSQFEWHPFTLTSAPHDSYLSVHIRAVGDWTNSMYDKLKDYRIPAQERQDLESGASAEVRQCPLGIKVAGPYGAPSQNYQDYQIVVCVGAGIGVTPFASILSSVLHQIRSTKNHNTKKVYFHWVVRTRGETSWFTKLLEEIAVNDVSGILSINIHVTSMKQASDLRLMLLRLAEFEKTSSNDPSRALCASSTRFGRPNWKKILTKHQEKHSPESKIGVFYCGPNSLKRDLRKQCNLLNQQKFPKLCFHREVF